MMFSNDNNDDDNDVDNDNDDDDDDNDVHDDNEFISVSRKLVEGYPFGGRDI